jgi:multidrug efflux pump subunit AcrB
MISKFSVNKPYTVFVAIILIIVLGVVSLGGMTIDLFPTIELPIVIAVTTYPGASPELVELEVTRPLESALGATSGVTGISSISNENLSIVIIEFAQGVNMDSAMIDLSGSIDMAYAQLDSAIGRPVLMRINPDMMPVMIATIDMEGKDLGEISDFTEEVLLPAFERVNGVASVTASGLLEEELHITLNQAKIDQLNILVKDDIELVLDEAEATLRSARWELASAQTSLNQEQSKQQAQLSEASAEIDSAVAQLNALMAEETLLKTQQAAFEQEKEMLDPLVSLNTFFEQAFTVDITSLNPEELQGVLENLPIEMPAQLAALSPEEIIETRKMALQAAARTAAVDSELQNIAVRLMTIETMLPQIESGLSEAVTGYEQIESGKMTLSIELAKAQMQLESGRSEIDKGLAELEDNREDAIDNASLSSMLTPSMISNLLIAQNFAMPAGYIGDEGHVVKVSGQFDSISALENAVLFSLDSVGDILVSDVADVEVNNNASKTYAKVNGNDAVVLSFQKQSTASTTVVAESIYATITDLTDQHSGLRVLPLMDQGENITEIIDSVWQNLLIGGVMAILILLFFLKDYRPTLIIALSIPISLMFAITLMYFSNVTLNIISLSGLALGVGMLVDNSVVVIENIYRMRNDGESVYVAAVQGAQQVGGALFASTLTTVCVFLPIVFTQGLTRQLFTDMGLTIAYSLIASLIIALTLVPTMASTLLKKNKIKKPGWFERFAKAYGKLLYYSLKYKPVVLILATLLLGLSIYGTTVIGISFMPEMETTQMSASLTMPPESDLEDTYATGDRVMAQILEIDEVSSVGAMTGNSSGMMGFSQGDLSFYIRLQEDRSISNAEVANRILEKTEDVEGDISVSTSDMDMSVLGGSGIEIIIKSASLDDLYTTADAVENILLSIEGVAEVTAGDEDGGLETRIEVDKDAAMREGLTVVQVFQEISGALALQTKSTTLRADQGDYPVVVVSPETNDLTRDNIGDYTFALTEQDGTEKEVLLSDIALVSEAYSPSSIRRQNQSRYLAVTASLDEGYNIGLVSRDIESRLADYTPPSGVTVEIAGETEMIQSATSDMILMIVMAVIFIYLIMVAQFQSLRSPFIILFTLPLAFTGGLLLLWITGIELSLPALLGFLVLSGVVVNNGIVFIDYVNKLRESGREKRRALVEAGMVRLRPILMTTITTVLAMTPIALGLGSGSESTQPMAVVAIGGLTYATLLTLLVVPIMYDLLNRKTVQ